MIDKISYVRKYCANHPCSECKFDYECDQVIYDATDIDSLPYRFCPDEKVMEIATEFEKHLGSIYFERY